ncbi:MAG TPA: hypothetical protein VF556_01425 [Pyrinomonadaceae bacterium]|jgi:hypothetical protein
MEILIIGGALVALMVYVSTRVKNSAATAYERETIETEKFFIVKPENFINPVGEKSEFVFAAYSKDFGTGGAEELRQAQVDLRIYVDKDFDEVCRSAKHADDKIVSEETTKSGDEKICILKNKRTENEIEIETFYKIVETKNGREIYELKISVLSDYEDNYSAAVSELLESFRVK